MSTPDNPFGTPELPPDPSARPNVPAGTADAGIDTPFPVWTLGDVAKVFGVAIMAILFMSILAVMIATMLPAYKDATSAQIGTDPRIVVPAQVAGYLFTIWFVYRLVAVYYRQPFLPALHWNWPRFWAGFIFLGFTLSLGVQLLSQQLPIPKSLPIDAFFREPGGVWVMAIFGTIVAPFAEELFFRGLLYPTLVRRIGLLPSILATTAAFALLHAAQLGWSWAALLLMMVVGLVLTVVRAFSRSLAASVIVHVAYNGLIFTLLFIESHGFTRF